MNWKELFPDEQEDYTIETINEGKLGFTSLRGWREKLINDVIDDPRKVNCEIVAKTLLKYSLYQYKDIVINLERYKKEPQLFTAIELNLNSKEIEKFSECFFKEHKYLLDELKTYKIEDYKNVSKVNQEEAENKYNWPEDPIKRVYLLWCKYYERNLKVLERIGIVTNKASSIVTDIMERERRLNTFLKTMQSIPDIKPTEPDLLQMPIHEPAQAESIESSEFILQNEFKNQILDYLKASNENIKEQLSIAKENNFETKIQSERAFKLALYALIISASLGFISIIIAHIDSFSTTRDLTKKMDEIKTEISNINFQDELIKTRESICN